MRIVLVARQPFLGPISSSLPVRVWCDYRCVFLDADTLVRQNIDDLFSREELSAAPDVGWPDCFNSVCPPDSLRPLQFEHV